MIFDIHEQAGVIVCGPRHFTPTTARMRAAAISVQAQAAHEKGVTFNIGFILNLERPLWVSGHEGGKIADELWVAAHRAIFSPSVECVDQLAVVRAAQ